MTQFSDLHNTYFSNQRIINALSIALEETSLIITLRQGEYDLKFEALLSIQK